MHARTDHVARALVILSFSALLAIWSLTTPLAGYPDELDHYVRAVAMARGEFYGGPDPRLADVPEPSERSCCDAGNPNTIRWVHEGTRVVSIPARLAPEHFDCGESLVRVPFLCTTDAPSAGTMEHTTAMGTIEPLPYLIPGLATRLTHDPNVAYRLARLASATVSAILLAIAALALWPPRDARAAPTLAGLVVAISPMVLFVGSSASPSALEVTAGLAFFAVLLRIARPEREPAWSWPALGLAGAGLAMSRSLGPVWVVADVLIVCALAGPRALLAKARGSGRPAAIAFGAVLAASASTVAWEALYQPGVPFDGSFFLDQLGSSLEQTERIGRELVGVFGALDVPLTQSSYLAWALIGIALAGIALVAGRGVDRVLLITTGAAAVAASALIAAAVLRQNGFDVQGRHVLAFVVSVPLLAGELTQRRIDRLPRWLVSSLTCAIAVVAAAVHLSAVIRSGHHYGWDRSSRVAGAWVPPGGVALWIGSTVVATSALIVGVTLASVGRAGKPEPLGATSSVAPDEPQSSS